MSDYVPTDWVNNVTPVDDVRMDHLEAGVDQAVAGNPPVVVNGNWLAGVGGAQVWTPLEVIGTQIGVTAADMDFAWTGGASHGVYVATNAGGGSIRSYGAGPKDGSRLVIRNGSTSCTLKHNLAGGTGLKLYLAGATDLVLPTNAVVEFIQNGTFWFQVAQVPPVAAVASARIDYENAWAVGTPYQAGDVVRYNNVDYLAVNDSTGQTPPAAPAGIAAGIVDAKGDLIAASAADVVARLPVGSDGQILTADAAQALGIKWGAAPVSAGVEVAYQEFAANVSVTGASEGASQTVVTAPAFTADGSPYFIEFFAPAVQPPSTTGPAIFFLLFLDGVTQGIFGEVKNNGSSAMSITMRSKRRITPAAGSRTFSVRAYVTSGTANVSAGAGGSGVYVPGFIRVTKV